MKLTVLQPPYPHEANASTAKSCLDWMTSQLDKLEPGQCGLVVLPEYANAPGIGDKTLLRDFAQSHGTDFMATLSRTCKRLGSMIAVGAVIQEGSRWLNRALLLDEKGEVACHHDKTHLTDVESGDLEISPGSGCRVFHHNGINFAFAVCFDFYFPEYFAVLAPQKPDIIICPSYQRSETSERIRFISQTRALDSGAYIVRSSYSIGKGTVGGNSLVASPSGEIVGSIGDSPGVFHVEIDPHKGFVKPASHGRPPVLHRELIESHRTPRLYRPLLDRCVAAENFPFPRICAHRGASYACPENTLPAFGAALACGAHEIEFDLWMSADGFPVVCHDEDLTRTTNKSGNITELDWAEISKADAGVKRGEEWRGVRVPLLTEVFQLVDGHMALNIHIKNAGPDGRLVKMVCDLIREYGLTRTAYIAGCTHAVLEHALDYAPEIHRACLIGQDDPAEQLAAAKEYRCASAQFGRTVSPDTTRLAHESGVDCGLFWSDDPDEAREYVRNGIDIILTNKPHLLLSSGFSGRGGEDDAVV